MAELGTAHGRVTVDFPDTQLKSAVRQMVLQLLSVDGPVFRKPKASDITDRAVLAAIRCLQKRHEDHMSNCGVYGASGNPVSIWDIQAEMNMWPRKVVKAKLRSMVRRNVIDGCVHNGTDCRGDFTIK